LYVWFVGGIIYVFCLVYYIVVNVTYVIGVSFWIDGFGVCFNVCTLYIIRLL